MDNVMPIIKRSRYKVNKLRKFKDHFEVSFPYKTRTEESTEWQLFEINVLFDLKFLYLFENDNYDIRMHSKGMDKRLGFRGFFIFDRNSNLDIRYIMLGLNKESKEKVYLVEKPIGDYNMTLDYRLSNITTKRKDSFICKKPFIVSEQGRINIREGAINNRLTSEYSMKLSIGKRGGNSPTAKLTSDIVNNIRYIAQTTQKSQQQIADENNLARTVIADIINYRIWNEYLVDEIIRNHPDFNFNQKNLEYNFEDIFKLDFNSNYNLQFDKFKPLNFTNSEFEIYIFKPIDNQVYIEVYRNEEFYISFQLLEIEPNHRNKYLNYIILNYKGNRLKHNVSREMVYQMCYWIHLNLS